MHSQMRWDCVVILVILGAFVPWRSRARVTMLLRSGALASADRINLYLSTIAFQWTASAIILWRCAAHGLQRSALGLLLPDVSRALVATASISALLVLNQVFGVRRLAKIPLEKRGMMAQLAEKLLPRTKSERYFAITLVVTVAICEEFIYRGFIQTLFQQTLSSALAGAAISAAFFALAHLYQGRRGLLTTFVVGLIFSAVRTWTGSLWPSIFIHFATDLSAGVASSRLLTPAESQ